LFKISKTIRLILIESFSYNLYLPIILIFPDFSSIRQWKLCYMRTAWISLRIVPHERAIFPLLSMRRISPRSSHTSHQQQIIPDNKWTTLRRDRVTGAIKIVMGNPNFLRSTALSAILLSWLPHSSLYSIPLIIDIYSCTQFNITQFVHSLV